MFIESPKGLVIVLGCIHAGVVNTLDYIVSLTKEKRIYAVIGGMHLLNVSVERIEHTIEVLRQYDVQKLVWLIAQAIIKLSKKSKVLSLNNVLHAL